MKTARFKNRGSAFTLVEIMIVVAILGILLGLAFPNFLKSRTNAQKQVCIENLSQIESAKQIWGVEQGRTDGDVATEADLVGPTLFIKERPRCPAGGAYDYTRIGTNATCVLGPTMGHAL